MAENISFNQGITKISTYSGVQNNNTSRMPSQTQPIQPSEFKVEDELSKLYSNSTLNEDILLQLKPQITQPAILTPQTYLKLLHQSKEAFQKLRSQNNTEDNAIFDQVIHDLEESEENTDIITMLRQSLLLS